MENVMQATTTFSLFCILPNGQEIGCGICSSISECKERAALEKRVNANRYRNGVWMAESGHGREAECQALGV